jgi:FtsP/CotA-like multicopper oxidase with cupredoxin domain
LTGSHAGYDWGLNGKTFDPDDPLTVAEGERVEIVLRNKTAMPHPIHLHGHHFQVVAIDDERFSGAVRDTVLVPPERSVTIAFDADNPGHWAFHCHQLYHMAAGMMTSVRYEGYKRA